MKHTDGPWESSHAYVESRQGTVANCAYEGYEGCWRSQEEMFANARLIAAAPDLLSSLIELWEAGEWVWSESDNAMIFSIKLSAADHDALFIQPANTLTDVFGEAEERI